MKFKLKLSIYFILGLFAMGAFVACEDEDLPNGGKPTIYYVRVTAPESSDSLLVSAYQGSLVAIIGDNLGGTNAIWFNDLQAGLNPVYVSDQSILVSLPSDVPQVVDNKMKLYFSNGDSLLYDFEVEISKPLIKTMKCEYVMEGEVATIYGNYFYEPLTVTFSGGVEAEVLPAEDQDGTNVRVVVPAGAEKGPVTITTNFGTEESDFWFRDDRNIILGSDPYAGWWNESFVVVPDSVQEGDPITINGNYIRVNQPIGAWAWTEVAGGPADATGDISKNFPDDAILNPENYHLKFEVNTMKPFDNNSVRLNFGLPGEVTDAYLWNPPFDTEGEWETVVIPLEEVFAAYKEQGVTPVVNPDGYWTRILIFGGSDLDCDMSFDNFRVVPKELK